MIKNLIRRIRGSARHDSSAPGAETKSIDIDDDTLLPTLTDQIAIDTGSTPIHIPVFSPTGVAPRKQQPQDDMPGLPFMIRPAEAADIASLSAVFTRAVEGTASRDYNAAQITAWASKADDPEFSHALTQGVTILAEHHDQAIAFAQLAPNDCIRMLYVDPEWNGLGVATLMYQYLEDEARILGSTCLTTNASHTAKRFFQSTGFKAVEEETVEINGVALTRTIMEKRLAS